MPRGRGTPSWCGGVCAENIIVPDEAARITLDGQGVSHRRRSQSRKRHDPGPGAGHHDPRLHPHRWERWRAALPGRHGDHRPEHDPGYDRGAGSTQGGQGINVAQHSYAVIIGNTIQRNPISGIIVHEGSSARIGVQNPDDPTPRGNIIRNNGVNGGVRINRTSSARLAGNTISDNAGPGVSVLGTSFAVVSSSHIDGNAGDGVWVTQNSAVQLGGDLGVLGPPNETGVLNGGFGIRCSVNSAAAGRLATLNGKEGATEFDNSTDGLERDK